MDEFFKKFKKTKFGIGIFFIFLFQGCATLDLTLPLNEIESPQHQGRQTGIGIELAGTNGLQMKLSEDPSQRPYTPSEKHSVDSLFMTKPALNFYFWNRVTLSGGVIDSRSPFVKAKISILNGFREDTEPGRMQLALATEGSYQRAEASGNQNGFGGATGFPWKGTSELFNYKVGLSFGVHLNRKILPFVGFNYQQFQSSGTINHTAVQSDAGGSYKIKPEVGSLRTAGLGIDWRLNSRFFITGQFLLSQFNWYEKNNEEMGGMFKIVYVPM